MPDNRIRLHILDLVEALQEAYSNIGSLSERKLFCERQRLASYAIRSLDEMIRSDQALTSETDPGPAVKG